MPMKSRHLVLLCALTVLPVLQGCVVPLLAAGGVTGATLIGTDRRSTGAYVDDRTFEAKLSAQINDKYPNSHVNVNSFNRVVLLTGEVADPAVSSQIELLARGLPNVRRVINQMVVAPVSSLGNRMNDSAITSKVKARMVGSKDFSSNHVKVVTERGEVYLLGLVTPNEAAAAEKLTSETAGVVQVKPYFELLDPKTTEPAPGSPSLTVPQPSGGKH